MVSFKRVLSAVYWARLLWLVALTQLFGITSFRQGFEKLEFGVINMWVVYVTLLVLEFYLLWIVRGG